MKALKKFAALAALALSLVAQQAHAGIPTVDIPKMLQDVISWGTQFTAMADQLTQLQQNYEQAKNTATALKGGRGMGAILTDPNAKQVLGSDFTTALTKLQALGAAGASAQAKAVYDQIKTFDCGAQFPKSDNDRKRCESRAMVIPSTVALLNDSVARSQARVAELGKLIAQVDSADDMKAAADLQNRIAAEVAMLQNEKAMMDTAQAQLKAQADLNMQAAIEASHKRMVGGGKNPFGKS